MRIVSVVPIKLNNERLPGKNTKVLGGKPLISYILDTLLQEKRIDRRYVYCSNERLQDFLPEGIEFLKRPRRLDEPDTNFTQIFECFGSSVPADIYVYAHATAPFISKKALSDCIDAVLSGEYDSGFTAARIQDFLWKEGKPLNFDAANLPRSQDLTPVYRESSGIYVYKKEVFEKLHRRIGENPYIREIGYKEAVDINEPADFELAEKLFDM